MRQSRKNLKKDWEPAGEQMTLFSLAGSPDHANRTHLPESGLVKMMSATCGPRCLGLFGRYPQNGLWARTFSALLIGQEGWYSRRCKLTWSVKGTKYNRTYFQLRVLTLRTNEIGSGLLATPNTMDVLPPKSEDMSKNHPSRPGRTKSGNLREQVAYNQVPGLLKTPTKMDGEVTSGKTNPVSGNSGTLAQEIMSGYPPTMAKLGLWPTPTADDNPAKNTGKRNQDGLQKMAYQATGKTSQLNPQFVLEMMGFPPDWTLLPFLSQSGETNQSKLPGTP